ncbi:MAG: hypothetical protein ACM359_18755 [Bacillota bacterium]
MLGKRILMVVLAAVGLMVAVPHGAAAGTVSWDATADFTDANGNPNGAWTYGWMDSAFTTFTADLASNHNSDGIWWFPTSSVGFGVWKNGSTTASYEVQPGDISLHPGNNGEATIVRWTAPAGISGDASIVGAFLAGDRGSMAVAVRQNNSPIWSAVDAGAFDLTRRVAPGDTIDFAVYGGYYYGNTPLRATISVTDITAVPTPAAGLGGLALLGGIGGLRLLGRKARA